MRSVFLAFATLALLLASACGGDDSSGTDTGIQDPGTPDPGTPDPGTQDPGTTVECLPCLQPGLALRFTRLDVQEPSEPLGLPEFLNAIWAPDITASRLNIALRVESVEEIEYQGQQVRKLTVTAGSAWHDLTVDDVLPVNGGKTPTQYYFLSDAVSQFQIVVKPDCTFESLAGASLVFHPGPMDHALICSDGYPEMGLGSDRIPMARLFARGRFNDQCEIPSGYLEGCIAQQAACRICSFGPAPDYSLWKREPNPNAAGTPCSASYCEKYCAKNVWVNFGAFVEGLGVPLQCDFDGPEQNGDAMNGYLIAGEWSASKAPFASGAQ
ncbi:hypothetical protein KBD49_08640 [Myxococcota bacterium]|nr:hypothetical protein [Myxococcota bacterium]